MKKNKLFIYAFIMGLTLSSFGRPTRDGKIEKIVKSDGTIQYFQIKSDLSLYWVESKEGRYADSLERSPEKVLEEFRRMKSYYKYQNNLKALNTESIFGILSVPIRYQI